MEDDFRIFTEDTIKKITKFKIPYKWRDSCVDQLIDWKECDEQNPYTHNISCLGFRQIWEECQFSRERKIILTENLQPVPESIRRQSY